MSIKPIKKQPIGFILLLLICLSILFGTAASALQVQPGQSKIRHEFGLVLCPSEESDCHPIGGALTWSLSPNNGTATLSYSSETDKQGGAWFELTFNENACGTYIVTVGIARDSRRDLDPRFVISGKPPCSGDSSSPSSDTSLPSSGTLSWPTQLIRISGDDQHGLPGKPLANPFVVQVLDQDGDPFEGATVRFSALRGGGSLSETTPKTDANGYAESTLMLGAVLGTNKVQVNVEGISQVVVFSAEAIAPTLTRLSGNNQSATAGTALAHPFVVEVHDGNGTPLAGVGVTFGILTGGGTLSTTTGTTDANGQASSTLTLGSDPGTNTVEVSAENVAESVTFKAEATLPPPTPTSVSIISGDNQISVTGEPLATPFVTEVRDQRGDPMEGATVTFAVTAGDGSLSVATALTDADGQAQSTLTLGTAGGANTVEVGIEGVAETVTFTAEAIPPTLTSVSGNNQIETTGTVLADPFVVAVLDGNGNPLAGIGVTFVVVTGGGTLSAATLTTDANGQAATTLHLGTEAGTHTVEASAEGISDVVTFSAVAELLEFELSLPLGISLIHIPLKVRAIDGMPGTIESVSDLYDALGGEDNVIYLYTHDSETQQWFGYLNPSHSGRDVDRKLTYDTGIVANLITPRTLYLSGDPLGTSGNSIITLHPGYNLVGLPLRDSRIERVSDLYGLEGIRDNASGIMVTDSGDPKLVRRTGDLGDIAVVGGQGFIITVEHGAMVAISGDGWSDSSATAAAPLVGNAGLHSPVTDTNTPPILALSGLIVDSGTGLNQSGFRVTVNNLSTGKAVAAMTPSDETGYRSMVVDIETGRAAMVGDILEISAESPHPFIGVKPLEYTVTAEDVKWNLIQLPPLVAYEIPAETALLANYPNPFNPETWIPYRLAEDAFVTLTIYNGRGQVVRTFEVGHQIASTYEDRSKAIYWDGTNQFGESVASGVYFYHLTADEYSDMRKMLILK